MGRDKQPITLLGPPRVAGEPLVRPLEQIRIAVSGVLPDYEQMFAFELAHELAHVKMGARKDNYLVEMFAVAVSLEVLKRFPLPDQLKLEFSDPLTGFELAWPPAIRTAWRTRDEPAIEKYWQSQEHRQQGLDQNDWDYAVSSLGDGIVTSHAGFAWTKLLNASEDSKGCSLMRADTETMICQPDIGLLLRREPTLNRWGYSQPSPR